MIFQRFLQSAPPGTIIPKPAAKGAFRVKGQGTRRGQPALIYTIPNHRDPQRPYEKGVTAAELEAAYKHLIAAGDFSHEWFTRNLSSCAAEGSCNFTTIGGLFELAGYATYVRRGLYRKS